MKHKKVLIGVLSSVFLLSSAIVPILAVAKENSNKKAAVETAYEKPTIGEILDEGAYPDEIESSSSALAQEKEWYEYITYSKTPVGEYNYYPSGTVTSLFGNEREKILNSHRVVFYDPYDYSYGMTMEVSDVQSDINKSTISEFTTANSLGISYTHSGSYSWGFSEGIKLGFKEDLVQQFNAWVANTTVKIGFSQELSFSATQNNSSSDSETRSMTYNAIYFNSNGTPYAWKVVHYTVMLPLYCEIQTYINGSWVTTDTDYLLLTTIQGTCREYVKNEVVYIEHWGTGEPVTVDDFWDGFFSKENLKKAYQNKLLPNN